MEFDVPDSVKDPTADRVERRFRSYPKYRDSGIERIETVPTHWKVRKLKYVTSLQFSNVDKKSHDDELPVRLCNYTDVYYREHINSDLAFMIATANADEIDRFSLRRDDVLITKDSEDPNDIAVPTCVVDELNGVLCGYHLAQVRPHPTVVHGPYLARAFSASGIRDQFRSRATGITRHGLSKDTIGGSLFFIPPLDEQEAIAAFLDRETGRIDELIAKKQRLIELLAEKRTALISHAVTKGLNPDAPMKDSGIEWLGQVPVHWDIAPLYARYWLELGKMLDAKRITGEHLVPYVRNVDVQWDHVNVDDLPEMDIEPHEYRRFILADGDLLVCEGGEVGRSAIWCRELPLCAYQKAIHRLRPRSGVECVRFTFYALRHAANTGIFLANGNPNTIPHLTGEQLRVYRFPFPPPEEQEAIVAHVDEQTIQLDDLSKRIHDAIDQFREYRTALISAAVTGKIDVRESASVAPARQANIHFHRCVLAAEIVDRHTDTARFGRIKLQKLLILAERHLGLDEIQSQPVRAAAGPFDNRMMRGIHAQLKRQKWFDPTKTEYGTKYVPMEKQGGHREYFDRYWGDKRERFDTLIALVKPMRTEQAEIVATLYMAWNDFIIAGAEFDDEHLVSEVLNNWDKAKQDIEPDRWRKAIKWMREKRLVPFGYGSATRKAVTRKTDSREERA